MKLWSIKLWINLFSIIHLLVFRVYQVHTFNVERCCVFWFNFANYFQVNKEMLSTEVYRKISIICWDFKVFLRLQNWTDVGFKLTINNIIKPSALPTGLSSYYDRNTNNPLCKALQGYQDLALSWCRWGAMPTTYDGLVQASSRACTLSELSYCGVKPRWQLQCYSNPIFKSAANSVGSSVDTS